MTNQFKARLVKIYRQALEWGPLILLAVFVPGGSLLAVLLLRRQQAHGSAR
jgi:hypothetical protein